MKRFRFRLQRVLDARTAEERQQRRELAKAKGRLTDEENRLVSLQEEAAREEQRQRELVSAGAKVAELLLHDRWRQELGERILRQDEEVERFQKLVEERRRKLVAVRRDRNMLEKLREKRYEEHHRESLNEEQNILDDIGSRTKNGG